MLRILRLILSFMLVVFISNSYTMSDLVEQPQSEVVAEDGDICAFCREPLIQDILDLPCHADSHHKECYKQWALSCLARKIIPSCMLCRGEVNLNDVGVEYEALSDAAKRTFAVAGAMRILLLSLNKVINFQDISQDGREFAKKLRGIIKEMKIFNMLQIYSPARLEIPMQIPIDFFEYIPSLKEALINFEGLKELDLRSEQNMERQIEHQLALMLGIIGIDNEAALTIRPETVNRANVQLREIPQDLQQLRALIRRLRIKALNLEINDPHPSNLLKAIAVLCVFGCVGTLIQHDIPCQWDMNIKIMVGLMTSLTLYSLR